ncbi:hypothetical protein DSUL_100063 [Desulfovibrionales bacterium]
MLPPRPLSNCGLAAATFGLAALPDQTSLMNGLLVTQSFNSEPFSMSPDLNSYGRVAPHWNKPGRLFSNSSLFRTTSNNNKN